MAIRGFFVGLMLWFLFSGYYGGVVSYNRPPPRPTVSIHQSEQEDPSSPQQVHISLSDLDKMRIWWITKDFGTPATVHYGTSSSVYTWNASGTTDSYTYATYKSGEIHNVVIGPLEPDTVYYYNCGSDGGREFTFKTPPAQFPIIFAVSGDLGQTEWTQSTLDHMSNSNYDVLLLPGDLAYADTDQPLWDSFGRLVEPLASQRPWMVTHGNHELEKIPVIHTHSFTSYNARWSMPYQESGSDSNLYYSFQVAGVHVLMLGSYTDFEVGTPQYSWLQADLAKVDRKRTPWLVALIHAPWYNSNTAHQREYESSGMKTAMEGLLYDARVDIVFAGHVHAYERFTRIFRDQANPCGPVHITIGDGGNREGLAREYLEPKPDISMFRESSFGHGEFQVMNESHALWSWHRNDDAEPVITDSVWLTSLITDPACTTE
ncbi:hypothetical protein NE237_008853 [Protea cynaroides]|uniref:Purple acid phosphatase n=1 Tax=Protea cynaroides TaxID=273540 RepID=A0A9Q0QZR5_9MAGN|nr:hypothetical protein NE237_008853 [Protea cynaroides]